MLSENKYLLGIDLGTSSVKVIVIDKAGDLKACEKEGYNIISDVPELSEQNPNVWWECTKSCIKKIFSNSDISADQIVSIGFSGQMHGLVMIDKDGMILHNAIIHCDTRSQEQVEYLKENYGDIISNRIINAPYTGFLLPSLLWIKQEKPDIYNKIYKVMLPKDYIRFMLTNKVATDYSDASGTFAFDIKNSCWCAELLHELDIPGDIFPEIYNSYDCGWKLSEFGATETGFDKNVKIVCGGGDLIMQMIGSGAVYEKTASVNIGTSGQVAFCSDKLVENSKMNINIFSAFEKRKYITAGAIMSAGACINWITKTLSSDFIKTEEMSGLIFLPYLSGERTPHMMPDLTGMFIGLETTTTAAQMYTAVMEGVSFALYECMELCANLGMKAEKYILSGGGANIIPLRKIQSDIYDKPLYMTKTNEQAALGAAICAGVGAGIYKDIYQGIECTVKYKDTIVKPDKNKHNKYMNYYELYKLAFEKNYELSEKLALLKNRRDCKS